ncbi:MAG: response regulator [Geobacteraceae bacterium]|nr:response regulator [Geobacteraceae bacterium]
MDKQKILIVDDSELVLELGRDALEEAGYEVFTASNGVEANNYIFSGNKLDLIIFDVMLPVLDGDKKAKFLREKDIGKHIPILLISTKSEEELTRLSAEAGVDGFIHKPFTNVGIVASVRQFLAK